MTVQGVATAQIAVSVMIVATVQTVQTVASKLAILSPN
jgi:hypothetical protein